MAPVIGITSQLRDVATSYGAQPATTVTLSYSDSVVAAGGVPVVLPILDPEDVNRRAFSDQAKMIDTLGGIEAIMALPSFNHTPIE